MNKIMKRNRHFALFLVIAGLSIFVLHSIIYTSRFDIPEQLYSVLNAAFDIGLLIFLLLSIFFLIVSIASINLRWIFISIGIVILLLALNSITLVPDERMPADKLICNTNLRSLAGCYILYDQANSSYPDKNNWCDRLKPYYEEPEKLQCPNDKIGPCSYAMNANIQSDANELPGDLVVLFESAPGWNRIGGPDDVITNRHTRPGANIAFADGHVEFVTEDKISNLHWSLEND